MPLEGTGALDARAVEGAARHPFRTSSRGALRPARTFCHACWLVLAAAVVPGTVGDGVLIPKLAEYVSSPRVRASLAAFNTRCSAELPKLKEHARRYEHLERVLVFEPSEWKTQGIGTLVWWYLGAWNAGMHIQRAVFFSNGDSPSFEMNQLFHADAFSHNMLINWNWADPSVKRNVSQAMARFGLRGPDARIDALCQRALLGRPARCTYLTSRIAGRDGARARAASGLRAGPSAGQQFGTMKEAADALSSSRWVVLRLWEGSEGQQVRKWPTGWLARVPSGSTKGGIDCLMAAVLRPAPAVQRALLPLLKRADRSNGGLAGLHLRTHALDIVLSKRKQCVREEHERQAALLGLVEFANASAAGARHERAGAVVSFSLEQAWALWNRMASNNCPHCGQPKQVERLSVCSGLVDIDATVPALRGRGTFGRLLACTLMRSAQAVRARGGSAHLFLSSDSPGLLKLLRATPAVFELVITSENAPAHVQCDPDRKRMHDACGSSKRQEAAGVKAAVDLVMLSLSDWAVQYSTSTFFDTALGMNALFTPENKGQGECIRAPWSEVGCKRGWAAGWTFRCEGAR